MYKPAPGQCLDVEVTDCEATAALLRSLDPLVWSSQAAAFAVVWRPELWPALLPWAVVLYLAVRVRLDAGLFALLAREPLRAPALLDDWLGRSGLRRSPAGAAGVPRGIASRCQGARRLALRMTLAWAVQMAVVVWRLL